MSIRKILVAVDGSDPYLNTSTYAIELAKRNDAELIVLYIGRMEEIERIDKNKGSKHD